MIVEYSQRRFAMKMIAVFGLLFSSESFANAPTVAASKPTPPKHDRYENLELFQKVLTFIESNYVDEVKNKNLMYGAIKGMFETLDPHSNFLPAEVFRDMKIDTAGKFGGLGIELGMKDNVLTIIAPIEGTPAWRAGLKANDRIVKINGESTKGMSLTEAASKMRGKPKSSILMSIYRDGFEASREVELTRELVKIQSTKQEALEPNYGYVRLSSFNETAAQDIRKAIESMEKKEKLRGLVLDLRGNPGGLLDQAVDVVSLFLDEGIVVSTIGREKDSKEIRYAKKGRARKDIALAVLVSSSSASASEIVAGALQDHHRAIIMGQPTFGKGSVQTVVELGKDLGMKLTIARYYTPSGKSIQERGVVPDIMLDDFDSKLLAEARRKAETLRERDLKGHMTNTEAPPERKDFQIEELNALAKSKESRKKGKLTPAEEDEMTPQIIQPKEDYQVQEALNYLKSYDVFKRLAAASGGIAGQAAVSASATSSPPEQSKQ